MRIRNGFVSNSSSSSFILKFSEVPTSIEHLSTMLGLDNQGEDLDYYGHDVSKSEVLRIIYRDIKEKLGKNPEKHKFNDLKIDSSDFYISEYDPNKYDRIISPEYKKEYSELKKSVVELSKIRYNNMNIYGFIWNRTSYLNQRFVELVKESLSKKFSNSEDYFIEVEYGDEDGSIFGYIEHSGVLDPIQFMRFSKH